VLPSGGSISYIYSVGSAGCSESGLAHPIVTSRSVDANDGNGPQTWQYDISSGTVTDPMCNKTIHTFGGGSCFPYETQTQQFDNGGNLIKTVVNTYSYVTWPSANMTLSTIAAPYNVLPTGTTTIWPNGQQSQVSYTYDRDQSASFKFSLIAFSNGQVDAGEQPSGYTSKPWTVIETDYGSGTPGPTLRTTNTRYQWSSNPSYFAANLLAIPASVTTLNGAGTRAAETDYTYDESGYAANSGTFAGSATTVSNWLNTGGSVVSHTSYNSDGMPTQIIDPKGNATMTTYQCSGAFPFQVTNALNQATTYGYDCNTGLLTSVQDPNGVGSGQAIGYRYDSSSNVIQAMYPDGGSTIKSYNNYANPLTVTSTTAASPDPTMTSSVVYDGLGRPSTSTAPNGAMTVTTYDGDGRVA
jgi:hypothetical protein